MSKKLDSYTPLSKREMRGFFEPYRQAFPDWTVEHDFTLTRSHGPLKQVIYFNRLGYAAYRPGHSIHLLFNIPDGCSLLNQHLDIKHSDIHRREHAVKWPDVINAMKEQFSPSVVRPLEVGEVLRLAEEEVEQVGIDNINYYAGLATLNLYTGEYERALYWCDRAEKFALRRETMNEDTALNNYGGWIIRKRDYANALKKAIVAGKGCDFLPA